MDEITSRLSLTHRAWRLLPAATRRRLVLRGAALIAPRIASSPPAVSSGIIVAGELTRASGLGESARLMLRGLRHLGIACWPLDIGPLLPAHRQDMPGPMTDRPPSGAALVLHVNGPMLPMVMARLPRSLVAGRRVVGFLVWELPALPAEWRAAARCMHHAWVPSRFAAGAIETVLPGRVRVVSFPVAVTPPRPAALDRPAFGLPDRAIVVLASANLASSFARKNPLAAIAAFRAAFADCPDRILVLKLGNPDHFPADFARIAEAVSGAPNIRLDTRTLPTADALALTAAADIVLSLHRSEGFGLVLAEAMLLGKPVVATGWSGNMDFMDESCAMLVPCRLVPAIDPRHVYDLPGALWAEPDIPQAAALLRQLADDAGLRATLGARARQAAARLDARQLADAIASLGLSPDRA
ncbi:MAG TPA: glycosyltransferase [Acetobacteraceae bacterium]|nr:glycosyltransferase [Acetobacteraceae bacterium]